MKVIDFEKIKRMNVCASNLLQTQLNDPFSSMDDNLKDQLNKEEKRLSRAAKREQYREAIRTQKFASDMMSANDVSEAVQSIWATRDKPFGDHVGGGTIAVQLSDLHLGGTVAGLEARTDSNVYNLDVAAHRLAILAEKVIFFGAAHCASNLAILLTGDMFDSKIGKLRLDKVLNSENSACESYCIGRDLIFQFIDYLKESEVFGSLQIHGIAGNEARLYAERGHSHVMAGDNFDALLNADLSRRYTGSDVESSFGVNRYVAEIEGWRILMIHGDQAIDKNCSQKTVQSLLGTHEADFGVSGHIHDTLVKGNWVRSASLIGTDYYAGDGLDLQGRATQNVFWLAPGQRNVYNIDLQKPDPAIEPFQIFDYSGAFGSFAA